MNRMFKYVAVAFLLTFSAFSASAQDDRTKFEFFGGYSYLRADDGAGDHVNANGFNASLTGNFHRYVGAKFDFSTHSKDDTRLNQFLGGLQFKDNKMNDRRVKPFAHVLAGLANTRFTGDSSNDFAMVIGAGIDVKVSKRVDIRLIQADYNPVFVRDSGYSNTSNNFRLGVGIVIH